MSLRRAHGLASLVLFLAACAEGGADDPTKVDGSAHDGSATDVATDAPGDGKGDAPGDAPGDAARDADAAGDGTVADATPDSAAPDSATPDTGTPDTGTPDTGDPDTGPPDTGTPDTGTPDTGSDAIVLFPCTKDTDCVSPFNCCVPSSKSCGVKVVITCVPFP